MADSAFSSLNTSSFFCYSAIVTRISFIWFCICICTFICICLWGKNLLNCHLCASQFFCSCTFVVTIISCSSYICKTYFIFHRNHCIYIYICGRGKNCISISGCASFYAFALELQVHQLNVIIQIRTFSPWLHWACQFWSNASSYIV